MAKLSPVNRTLSKIPKRAEKQEAEALHRTFSDSGVFDALDTVDNQILYGRRGTGKTHALNYLSAEKQQVGDLAVYLDLRTIGSPVGVSSVDPTSRASRATRLLVDVLTALHEELVSAALNGDIAGDAEFVEHASAFADAITRVRVEGPISQTNSHENRTIGAAGLAGELNLLDGGAKIGVTDVTTTDEMNGNVTSRSGLEIPAIYFGDVARSLRKFAASMTKRKIWVLFDEWSSVPEDLQPYLAEFLLRTLLPIKNLIVKIAAIEHQSTFRHSDGGVSIGFEVGADIAANINLDDFMVYEGNEERSVEFFSELFARHVGSGDPSVPDIKVEDPSSVVSAAFADSRAFAELVRAAEGVPRDALNIAGMAAGRALDKKITVPVLRAAARDWYQSDKLKALEDRREATSLLHWIINEVIREKKARAFLVSEEDSHKDAILVLFDARVLHLVRRGYSAQDRPGTRFNIWNIDYGAYIDLVQTKNAPRGALLFDDGSDEVSDEYVDVDVPSRDHRAIRRAILTLSDFQESLTDGDV